MAKVFFEGNDIRKTPKVCYLCNQEITNSQAFAMELIAPPRYKHFVDEQGHCKTS